METTRQNKLDRIKNRALELIKNVTIINVKAKKMKLIAYYDWKNDSVIINESMLDTLSEGCLTYIVVHELIHKITRTRNHDARFLTKLISIYDLSNIIKYETEITAFSISNQISKDY
jgi:predicted metal-dependent hydrolase